MQTSGDGSNSPQITIYAESGPLAGDLAACLSGRFEINRVTSPKAALTSLARGCKAMLILKRAQEELGPARLDLVKQALEDGCRVVILGSGGLGLESGMNHRVVQLPPLPSPQLLFETLSGLEPEMQSGSS